MYVNSLCCFPPCRTKGSEHLSERQVPCYDSPGRDALISLHLHQTPGIRYFLFFQNEAQGCHLSHTTWLMGKPCSSHSQGRPSPTIHARAPLAHWPLPGLFPKTQDSMSSLSKSPARPVPGTAGSAAAQIPEWDSAPHARGRAAAGHQAAPGQLGSLLWVLKPRGWRQMPLG